MRKWGDTAAACASAGYAGLCVRVVHAMQHVLKGEYRREAGGDDARRGAGTEHVGWESVACGWPVRHG